MNERYGSNYEVVIRTDLLVWVLFKSGQTLQKAELLGAFQRNKFKTILKMNPGKLKCAYCVRV